ncbi:MAG TPA: S26 family signal peptidase, partial [Actinomycetota bacterium]|nr:S26 family signal peptidase [Actinomycetota bacterium]
MGTATTYHRRRRGLFALLAVGAACLWLARRRPFRAVVSGPSMEPELHDGDVVLALAGRRPRTGDVVVVEHPERDGFEMVKRVAGGPGEVVHLLADGTRLPEPVALRAGEWFVVGDARGASTDSRSFGPVGPGQLHGVV